MNGKMNLLFIILSLSLFSTKPQTFKVTKQLSSNLRLMELNTGKKARVITALRQAKQHLFNYQV